MRVCPKTQRSIKSMLRFNFEPFTFKLVLYQSNLIMVGGPRPYGDLYLGPADLFLGPKNRKDPSGLKLLSRVSEIKTVLVVWKGIC